MPLGTHHNITGKLTTHGRRIVVEVDGGGTWELDLDPRALKLLGERVTVQGVRSGFNMLDLQRIERCDAR